MLDVAVLEAAGLPSAEIDGWRASEPEPTASFEAASEATCAHLVRGEELLGRLPLRPERNNVEAEAAAALRTALDAERSRFLRAHADDVYAALTDDLRRGAQRRGARLRGRRALPRSRPRPARRWRPNSNVRFRRRRGSRWRRASSSRSYSHRRARAPTSCGRCCAPPRRRSSVFPTFGRRASPTSVGRVSNAAGTRHISRSGTTAT